MRMAAAAGSQVETNKIAAEPTVRTTADTANARLSVLLQLRFSVEGMWMGFMGTSCREVPRRRNSQPARGHNQSAPRSAAATFGLRSLNKFPLLNRLSVANANDVRLWHLAGVGITPTNVRYRA